MEKLKSNKKKTKNWKLTDWPDLRENGYFQMKKKAFITGINGQDGSYLSEYLLGLDYEVFGIVRRNSIAEHQESRIDHLVGNGVNTEYGDLLDVSSLERMIRVNKA